MKTKPKVNAEVMWFVKSPDGWLYPGSGRTNRKSCIAAFCEKEGYVVGGALYSAMWSDMKKRGHRVIKCRVTPTN